MRGKIRDKRITGKKDSFSREELERRRPYKRDSRTAILNSQQVDEDGYEIEFAEDGEELEAEVLPQK